ncbi:MAG TPA: potassium transporter TrkG [Caldilineaceae bacterium]|nr:potassium transporter TrkG [Caldilineaceae bacterium]
MNTPHSPKSPRSLRARPAPYTDKISVADGEPGTSALAEPPPKRRTRLVSGPWILIFGFALIIALGSILLKLPIASTTGTPLSWSEAIFTATSATTVTGLAVRNTANDFSMFGQVVILLLLQIGGVGFVSLSVLLLRLIGRRVTLQTRFLVQQTLATHELSGVLNLALYVLGVTLALEAAGALLLWLRWRTVYPDGEALWYAIFHSISSYCNAGFDLFSGTDHGILFGFGTDWYTLLVLSILILLGGFGITVMYDLWSARSRRHWSLNTRFTLTLTLLLTTVGFLLLWLDPRLHHEIYPGASLLERVSAGLFTIISARTAGVTILPLAQLSEATQLVILLWMFIGGAPASMAGGVSTSTVGVLLFAVIATAKGHTAAVAFQRTVPTETIAKAVAIMTVSTLLVVGVSLILSLTLEAAIFPIGFEVVSAFANAGYSLDFTGTLTDFGRYLIAFTMFWGRLGPLTIVVALAQSEQPTLVRYPEEPVILG